MSQKKLNVNAKVKKFEAHINDVLKVELKRVTEERNRAVELSNEYGRLKTFLETVSSEVLPENKPLESRVDLGRNFFAQAVISEPHSVYMRIGYGFHLEMTLDEALRFIRDKREPLLKKQVEFWNQRAAEIKGDIKFMTEALRELQGISAVPSPQHRDIF
ncbi:unnamed protein product [Cyprideis torosa]|uniref:Uncharacterized protein n=1 Tax=Cyprideis torosa TaxID=163714 RepID=A0A7R8WY25_9CRUS|nr:unnamed protein product [Cyprideis torosa]CAG0909093.1 unnamed protein product [Cyprideis torosa]